MGGTKVKLILMWCGDEKQDPSGAWASWQQRRSQDYSTKAVGGCLCRRWLKSALDSSELSPHFRSSHAHRRDCSGSPSIRWRSLHALCTLHAARRWLRSTGLPGHWTLGVRCTTLRAPGSAAPASASPSHGRAQRPRQQGGPPAAVQEDTRARAAPRQLQQQVQHCKHAEACSVCQLLL